MRSTHPFWQSEEKYRQMYESQGLHMMVFMLDNQAATAIVRQDLFVRVALATVALLAFLFFGLAWRGINRSTQLQIRLARARAMNNYLRELNLAAAGLAHETRNPLNIVRGITQTICASATTPAATREQLQPVMDEVDRVTARLNEFIDYSKPREPHLVPVSPTAVARDVARTLESDFEDKGIRFLCPESDAQIMADPTLLRQVLFNLMLNAVQAVGANGTIEVRLQVQPGAASLAVVDDGCGVPPEARGEIFRPYFTLRDHGTGLGLAVVRQIVLAHGWDVTYEPGPEKGSILCLSGLQLVGTHTA
jgi:signal transduction histidine kinase